MDEVWGTDADVREMADFAAGYGWNSQDFEVESHADSTFNLTLLHFSGQWEPLIEEEPNVQERPQI